jgi:hypothetical protein
LIRRTLPSGQVPNWACVSPFARSDTETCPFPPLPGNAARKRAFFPGISTALRAGRFPEVTTAATQSRRPPSAKNLRTSAGQIVDRRLDLEITRRAQLALKLGDTRDARSTGAGHSPSAHSHKPGRARAHSFNALRPEAGFFHEHSGREVFWHALTFATLSERRTADTPLPG